MEPPDPIRIEPILPSIEYEMPPQSRPRGKSVRYPRSQQVHLNNKLANVPLKPRHQARFDSCSGRVCAGPYAALRMKLPVDVLHAVTVPIWSSETIGPSWFTTLPDTCQACATLRSKRTPNSDDCGPPQPPLRARFLSPRLGGWQLRSLKDGGLLDLHPKLRARTAFSVEVQVESQTMQVFERKKTL